MTIVKIMPHQRDFGAITRYALYGRDRDSPERVEWLAMRNLPGVDPELAHRVMEASSRQSKRVQKPCSHIIFGWSKHDLLTPDIMQEMVDRSLEELGLADHQAFYIAHNDTDCPHLHAIINRVHPDTGLVANDAYSKLKLRRSIMAMEVEFDLERTPFRSRGQHEQKLFSEIEIAKRENRPSLNRMSKLRCEQLRERLEETFHKARGWGDLDGLLQRRGYHLKGAGAGVRVADKHAYAKLSDLSPSKLNTKRLIQRWGSFSDYQKRIQEKEQKQQKRKRRRRRKRQALEKQPEPILE